MLLVNKCLEKAELPATLPDSLKPSSSSEGGSAAATGAAAVAGVDGADGAGSAVEEVLTIPAKDSAVYKKLFKSVDKASGARSRARSLSLHLIMNLPRKNGTNPHSPTFAVCRQMLLLCLQDEVILLIHAM